MANSYRLILQSGTAMGTEFPLEKSEIILGRDLGNDVVINDPEVSRRHLRLVMDGATFRLEDLGSTNGTFVHGQRLSSPILLRPGEIITLGEKVVLRYEVTSSSDPNATVVAQRAQLDSTSAAVRQAAPTPAAAAQPVIPPASQVIPPSAQNYPLPPRPQPTYQPVQAAPAYPPMAANIPVQVAAPKKKSKLVLVLIIVAAVILVFCVIPAIIVDATNSYCALAPGIMNSLFGQVCP